MANNQKVFAFVTGGIALVLQLLNTTLWFIYDSRQGYSFASMPPWITSIAGNLACTYTLVLAVWAFSKSTKKLAQLLLIIAAAIASIGVAAIFAMNAFSNLYGAGFVQIFLALSLGVGGGSLLGLAQTRGPRIVQIVNWVALLFGVLLTWFGTIPQGLSYWFAPTFAMAALALGLFGLLSSLRNRILLASSRKLSSQNLSTPVRQKKFLAAKMKSAWMTTGIAALVLAAVLLFGMFVFYKRVVIADPQVLGLLALVSVALVTLGPLWTSALIANRAMAKGKSWDAFFWLSIFVSPLLMWIIAEASTDTRGMAYAQPIQQPPQQFVQQPYVQSAPNFAPAPPAPPAPHPTYAPVAYAGQVATEDDSRACPECAETIKKAAKLCKHCGSKVTPVA